MTEPLKTRMRESAFNGFRPDRMYCAPETAGKRAWEMLWAEALRARTSELEILEALETLVSWFDIHVHGGGNTTAARKDYQEDIRRARAICVAKVRGLR